MIYTLLLIPGGGYYWEFLVGVWCPVLRILTLLQTKKCHFPHPFSDQISKIHTHFQTWPNLACSRLSISRGDSQFLPALFSCSRFLNSADPTIHRRTGYFLPGRAVNHLPKKFLQVAQIFTKQSNRNEGRCNKIGRTGI